MSYSYSSNSYDTPANGSSNAYELVGSSNGTSNGSYAVSSASYGATSGSYGVSSASYGASSGASSGAGDANSIANDLLALIGSSGSASGSASRASGSAYASASGSVGSSVILSEIERRILNATVPVEINESEEITVAGQRGIWLNKAEVNSWRGDLAISEYRIHEDSNPQVITKRVEQQVEYVQELAIRYLRPPTPPAPGEIVITMEPNVATGPAPPLIIRQQPARASTPEPLVVREAPPQPPVPVGPKRITISGKRNPPPPRKVVIERLAALPSKPQNVIVERWLPYSEVKRRVVFHKSNETAAQVATPRNVIVQWEAPSVNVRKEIKYLGVVRANPVEYVQRYGSSLKAHTALPQFVLDIATPSDVGVLAANYTAKSLHELEGQLEGFQYVNLDNEGLSQYRSYLLSKGIRDLGAGGASSSSFGLSSSRAVSSSYGASASYGASSSNIAAAAAQVFAMVDVDNSGSITVDEAESIVLKLNSRLNRSYGEDEVKAFFATVSGGSSQISKAQFLSAFEKLAN